MGTLRIVLEIDTDALSDFPSTVTRRAGAALAHVAATGDAALWPEVRDGDRFEFPVLNRSRKQYARILIDRSDVGRYDSATNERESRAERLWDLSDRLRDSPDVSFEGFKLAQRLDLTASLLVHRTAP